MALLLAAFGPLKASDLKASDWAVLEGGLNDLGGREGGTVDAWHDEGFMVRLAVLDPNGVRSNALRVHQDGVAAAVGPVGTGNSGAPSVLEAYARAGVAGLASLRGEYAYALWDRRERSLLVGCDAVGLHAPAYRWNGGTLLLCTRAVALLGQPNVPCGFDPVYLAHALSGLWSRPAWATAFDGVRRMVGGELIRVSAQGLERLEGPRLNFRSSPVRRSEEAVQELADVLDDAVAEDAQSAPACVALSGGIDSCVVATALAKQRPELAALTLVAPDGSGRDGATLAPLIAGFPGIRLHRVLLTGDPVSLEARPLLDDPVCAGPVMQSGRAALLRAARDLGFRRVLNGDGGDEIFDMAWRPRDLVRQAALRRLAAALASRSMARRTLRDFVVGGRGPLSNLLLERAKERVRARRPWLRAPFWGAPPFASAWQELVAYGRLRSARERLPEILGSHGRHWRSQELVRLSLGIQGSSPLLRQTVVELAGSLSAGTAIDLRHGKIVLRRLAAQRVPPMLAWRPKDEPLSAWLVERWIANDSNATRVVSKIRNSGLLARLIDPSKVAAAVDAARGLRGQHWLPSAIVELDSVVEWVTAIEASRGS